MYHQKLVLQVCSGLFDNLLSSKDIFTLILCNPQLDHGPPAAAACSLYGLWHLLLLQLQPQPHPLHSLLKVKDTTFTIVP